MYGGTGADTLSGGDGNDLLVAGTGAGQSLSGGAGDDTVEFQLHSASGMTIDGGDGNDVLKLRMGRSTNDIASQNTVGGVTTITFNDGTVVNFQSVETVHFTSGGDEHF